MNKKDNERETSAKVHMILTAHRDPNSKEKENISLYGYWDNYRRHMGEEVIKEQSTLEDDPP